MASRSRTIDFGWHTVYSNTASPTTAFLPLSEWMDAVTFAKIRATLEMRAKMGNIEVKFAYQTADSIASPDTAAGIGSFVTSDGAGYPSAWADISSVTAGKQWIRFGVLTQNTSGTTTNLARIWATLDYTTP